MRIADLEGSLTYIDANILIYAVEGYPIFADVLAAFMDGVERGELRVVSSELTLSEALVRPLRQQDSTVAAVYRSLLSVTGAIDPTPVTRAVLLRAAEVRAEVGGKLPDAIHAATAELTGCRRLLTADTRFKAPPDIPVVLLQDLAL